MKKTISLALVLVLMLSLVLPVSAAGETKTAEITYQSIKLKLDDETVVPLSAEGKALEPFIMDGSVYLPFYPLFRAGGFSAEWPPESGELRLWGGDMPDYGSGTAKASNATKSVSISVGGIQLFLYGSELSLTDAQENTCELITMDGDMYIPLEAVSAFLGKEVRYFPASSTVRIDELPIDAENIRWTPSEISLTESYADGYSVTNTTHYIYDHLERLTAVRTKRDAGQLITTEEYTYHYQTGKYLSCYTEDLADQTSSTTVYNNAGQPVISSSSAPGTSQIEYLFYDAQGRESRSILSQSRDGYTKSYIFNYSYNGNTRSELINSSEGGTYSATTVFSYDAAGNLSKEVFKCGSYSSTAQWVYDAEGRLTLEKFSSSDGDFYEHSWAYNSFGDLTKETYSAAGDVFRSAEYFYDEAGRYLGEKTADNAGSREVRLNFDIDGFISTVTVIDSKGSATLACKLDGHDNVVRATGDIVDSSGKTVGSLDYSISYYFVHD